MNVSRLVVINCQPLVNTRSVHYRLSWFQQLSTSAERSSSSSRGKHVIVYSAFGGMALGAAYFVGHLHEELGGFEGIERSLSFYSVAIPRYIEYRLMQWRDKGDRNEEWEELHRRASQQGLDKIMELRGFYIKTGQMAASNIGNACTLYTICPCCSFFFLNKIWIHEILCTISYSHQIIHYTLKYFQFQQYGNTLFRRFKTNALMKILQLLKILLKENIRNH